MIATRRRRAMLKAAGAATTLASIVTFVVCSSGTSALTPHTPTLGAPSSYSTLFPIDSAPSVRAKDTDPNSVELGLRFVAKQTGSVAGLRFFRAVGETGAHQATLWDATGHALGMLNFAGSSTSGWQYAAFTTPVGVRAGGSYVASYHSQTGYAAQNHFFDRLTPTSLRSQQALALPSTDASQNGVYAYGSAPVFPKQTWASSNYWIDVLWAPSAPSGPAPTASPTVSPTATPTSHPSSSGASTSPAPPSSSAPTSTTSYVQPGSVGYLGSVSSLTSYAPGGAAPAGCAWGTAGLRCNNDTLTLDHAFVHGGIYFAGSGQVTITNSIIEGGAASEWTDFYAASPSSASRVTFVNDTLRWAPGKRFPSGIDVAPIWVRGNQPMTVQACDISGLPQGLDPTGNSIVKDNWIHGLFQSSTDPNLPTHLDGIFSQGGNNITITGNYVDAPTSGAVTAGIFLQEIPDAPMLNIVISGNFLRGGAFTFYNESGQGVAVTNNVFGGGIYGDAHNTDIGTIGTWSGNVRVSGTPVPKP